MLLLLFIFPKINTFNITDNIQNWYCRHHYSCQCLFAARIWFFHKKIVLYLKLDDSVTSREKPG